MFPSASDVSIVTVNWNGREHLASLLPSLEPLGCREIIVVDNGSADGSIEFLAASHPEVRTIRNSENLGFAHPCNQGAQAAKGEIVAFINNDMKAEPGWISESLRRFTPSTPCVASRILDWDGKRIDYNGSSLQYLGFALQRDIGRLVDEVSGPDRVLFPCGGAFLIDRDIFLDSGGFDPDYFAIFEDVDLGWRLWILGHEVAFAPDSVVRHRGHSTFGRHGQRKMRYLMHRNALLTVLKNYQDDVFERLLPLALRLTVKRVVLLTGVERESFYLWAAANRQQLSSDVGARDRWTDAMSQLVALDDVLEAMPSLLEKRRLVQSKRKRDDAQILDLFVDPMRTIVDDPNYRSEEAAWLKYLNLDSVFEGQGSGQLQGDLASDLERRVRELKRELKALQFLGSTAFERPPIGSGSKLRKLLESLRRDGSRVTLRRVIRRFRRAV